MSSYAWPTRPERTRRFLTEAAPRPTVTVVATQARPNGEIRIAVLKRPGAQPILTIDHARADGSRGARTVFQLDELADLDAAIAIARGGEVTR